MTVKEVFPRGTKASGQTLGFFSFFVMSLKDAAYDGDLEALRDRIERGDDVDGRDEWGSTPLIWACGHGQPECAQALIEAGAAVDMVNNNGWTALMAACVSGHLECAQALIDAGAVVDMVDNGG